LEVPQTIAALNQHLIIAAIFLIMIGVKCGGEREDAGGEE
jgi:hypothetical protein